MAASAIAIAIAIGSAFESSLSSSVSGAALAVVGVVLVSAVVVVGDAVVAVVSGTDPGPPGVSVSTGAGISGSGPPGVADSIQRSTTPFAYVCNTLNSSGPSVAGSG